ncbi:MAG: hypothetical protein AAFZ87_10355 [Planctomycetota bacterium]
MSSPPRGERRRIADVFWFSRVALCITTALACLFLTVGAFGGEDQAEAPYVVAFMLHPLMALFTLPCVAGALRREFGWSFLWVVVAYYTYAVVLDTIRP